MKRYQANLKDGVIVAWLHGAAARHAQWSMPTGDALDAALAELRDLATPGRTLRADLLAHAAGVRLGVADVKGKPLGLHDAMCGELLIAAGAGPPELVEEWRAEGQYRAKPARAPFSQPLPGPSAS